MYVEFNEYILNGGFSKTLEFADELSGNVAKQGEKAWTVISLFRGDKLADKSEKFTRRQRYDTEADGRFVML